MRKTYSVNGLSEVLHCDRRSIKKALRDTPPVRHRGAIEYFALSDAVRALRATKPNSAKEALVQRKLLSQCARLEFDLEVEKKQWINAVEAAAALGQLAAEQKSVLRQKLECELPVELAGLDAIAIRGKLKTIVDQICGMMQPLLDNYEPPPSADPTPPAPSHD